MKIQNFSTYKNFQYKISTLISEVKKISAKFNYSALTIALDNLQKRINDETFTISFIGEIKRGKSSLINALLGHEILPKSAIICTSVLCIIKYGVQPKAKVIFKDNFQQQIKIDELKNWVTKKNPDSTKISYVEIEYPSEILSKGIVFVDTPGVNDTDEIRRKITEEFIPNSDGIIFVLNVGQPLTDSEMKFLHTGILKHHLKKLWFVVNAIDKINDASELNEILDYIQKNISHILPNPKIFCVSAKWFIDSIKFQNHELQIKSKIPEFLEHFSTDVITNKWQSIVDMPLYLLGQYIKELERSLNWELQTVSNDIQAKRMLELALLEKCNNFLHHKNKLYENFCLEIETIIYELSQTSFSIPKDSYVSAICLILQQPALSDSEVEKQLNQLLYDQIQIMITDIFNTIKQKINSKACEYINQIQQMFEQLDFVDNANKQIEIQVKFENLDFSNSFNFIQDINISNALELDLTALITKFAPVLSLGFVITGNWLYAAISIYPIFVKIYTLEKAPDIIEKFKTYLENANDIIKQNIIKHKKEISQEIANKVFSYIQNFENIVNDIISRINENIQKTSEINEHISTILYAISDLNQLISQYNILCTSYK